MSLRIRANGGILCGAKSEPEEGDTYINDRLHYLFLENGYVMPDPKEQMNGLWYWRKYLPYWDEPWEEDSMTEINISNTQGPQENVRGVAESGNASGSSSPALNTTPRRLPPALEEKAYGPHGDDGEVRVGDLLDWLYGKKAYGPGNILLDESTPGLVERVEERVNRVYPEALRMEALRAELADEASGRRGATLEELA